jgi:hypothetical protein
MVRHSKRASATGGHGCHTRDVETFGSLLRHQEPNRALFEEQANIIFNAFNNERFSHKGKFYTLPHRLEFPTSPVNGTATGMRHPRVRSC